ncbi:hypothetical protein HYH03_002546 [Edaphochlamys debaryana]|uniref:RRM domain-containing protein n=1 Tax=Edaphochlamys debaryana TaxID=47281 RepID=A0A835YAX6_9CHLO|nr:hypothetical protein HYH03_002546 [Edaphochlamys debaryana]|eukprot:KAG2499605.1 hypothetical protein HYH03_002546 [Edaphochlamys debaryana]
MSDESEPRTVYAKSFSKGTTEDAVKQLFSAFGSVRRVRLRREAATNAFRGSVYVEFKKEEEARAAVARPPSNSAGPLTVMMKADYERRKANATSSGGTRDGSETRAGSAATGGGGGSSSQKRPRHRLGTEGAAASPLPPPPPLPSSHGGAAPEPAGRGVHGFSGAEDGVAVRALEEQLRREKEDSQRLYARLAEAQQRASEAANREAAANAKLLAKEVEIGSLKGEITMLRTQGAAQLERQTVAHKARVTELEAALQQLKDKVLLMEREREQRKGSTPANGAAPAPGRRAGGGTGTGAAGEGAGASLDDL